MRLFNLLHLEHLFNDDLERPIDELRQSMLNKLIPQFTLICLVSAPQCTALKPDALPEKSTDVNITLCDVPAHSAEEDNVRVSCCCVEVLVEIASANKVHD